MAHKLDQLLEDIPAIPASVKKHAETKSGIKRERISVSAARKVKAKLMAQIYLQNGLDIGKAYEAATGLKWRHGMTVATLLGDEFPTWLEEINKALDAQDVTKDMAVALLWTMLTVSPLDFMDDEGIPMTIAELKKLPPVLRSTIEEISVVTDYEPIVENGVIKTDKGVVLLRPVQRTKIKLKWAPSAMSDLSKIMKWIGPTTLIKKYHVTFAQIIQKAKQRVIERRALTIEHKP